MHVHHGVCCSDLRLCTVSTLVVSGNFGIGKCILSAFSGCRLVETVKCLSGVDTLLQSCHVILLVCVYVLGGGYLDLFRFTSSFNLFDSDFLFIFSKMN